MGDEGDELGDREDEVGGRRMRETETNLFSLTLD